jgi:hypothetical protein
MDLPTGQVVTRPTYLLRRLATWTQRIAHRGGDGNRSMAHASQAEQESLWGARLSKAETLLLDEFEQAWIHYRHLETMRGQYLGFFFTISLGSITLSIPAIGAGALDDAPQLVALSGFVQVFFLLTALIYISVRKLGIVLAHYERVIGLVRSHFYAEDSTLVASLHVREMDHPVMRSRLFRVQGMAEAILRLFFFLSIFGELLLLVRLMVLRAATWQLGLVAVLAVSILTGTAFLMLAGRGTTR